MNAPFADDVQLAARAAGGDERARGQLIRRALPTVRRVSRSLVRKTCDADDAAQSALIEIIRSAHTFRGDASLESWVRRIAIRATLRYVRRERRWATRESGELDGHADLGSMRAEAKAAASCDIESYLANISQVQRQAIVLHYVLGHSLDECAALERCSANTIKSRLRLGLSALRKLMRREQNLSSPTPLSVAWARGAMPALVAC